MKPWQKVCVRGLRACGACCLAFAVWTLWLGLALLLVAQVYFASTSELELPGFVLRAFEDRLAASGVRATFGRTAFDPTGRVLIEDLRLSLPEFAEPVVTIRGIYARLDPWDLALGRFQPSEVRVTGASLSVPAMLAASGRADEVLRDLDATFVPGGHELAVAQFSARIAGVATTAHGAVHLPGLGAETGAPPLPVADFLAHNFPAICRSLAATAERLSALDQPALHLELAPSESRLAIASVTLFARGLKLDAPLPLQATGLHLVTKLPLFGEAPVTARLELTADELHLPFESTARGARVAIRGTLRPAQFHFEPLAVELAAESLEAAGFSASALAAQLTPGPLPQLNADAVAQIMGAPLAVHAHADFTARTAALHFAGAVSPTVLGQIGERLHLELRKYFDFAALDCAEGEATFGAGWKFEKLTARVALRGIDAYSVPIDEGRAVVEFDGRRFHAPEAWARIGENFARGTFDQDLTTFDYRFLLEGRLRPLAISGWFRSGWWANFFQQFELPVAPPVASVDVIGRWTDTRYSAVFVYADPIAPVIRGVKLDRARGLLFIRPGFYDGLEIFGTSGPGAARGTFTYATDPATFAWRRLDFSVASSIDPVLGAQMIGPAGLALLEPFAFAQPPALKVDGRLDGPAAPGGPHETVLIEARSPGEFRFRDFPLENIAFTAAVHDDEIAVDNLRAGFAGGVATGHARVWGRDADRRVRFDFALRDASLGRAAATLQQWAARRKGAPLPAPGRFVQERANVRVDATAAAEGRYDNPFSYQGEGNAVLQGQELGEVPLLGLLSEVLRFTALRFTSAKATFKIDGANLVFPEFNLRGANSAIDAHGEYALDRGELNFRAKLFPFQESGNALKSIVGAVLSPLSSVFEINITGALDHPSFALALGSAVPAREAAPGENPPAAANPAEPATPTPAAAPAAPPASASPPVPSDKSP